MDTDRESVSPVTNARFIPEAHLARTDATTADIVALAKPFEKVVSKGRERQKNEDTAHSVTVFPAETNAIPGRLMRRRSALQQGGFVFRHKALIRRKRSCILSLVFAIVGLILMAILNEWTFDQEEETDTSELSGYALVVGRTIRCLLVISTVALLASILVYHISDLQLYMNQQGIDDWRIAISKGFVIKLLIELLICSICPIPGNFYFWWWSEHYDGATVTEPRVPLDILLSIPMFFRFYLVPRVLLLCLPLFDSAATKVVASLNRVRFSLGFVLKALLTLYPAISLLIFASTYVASASYLVRLCERYQYLDANDTVIAEAQRFTNYLNNVWYIGITFLTIGYGDIVVNTYCGRAVGFLTGMIGVALTALIINVVSAKMHLSNGEARVFEFVGSHSLRKNLRHSAANVIRETWLVHKLKHHRNEAQNALQETEERYRLRHQQRRFMKALKRFRRLENLQRAADDAQSPNIQEMCEQNRKAIDNLRSETSRNFETVQLALQECNVNLLAVKSALCTLTSQKLELDLETK